MRLFELLSKLYSASGDKGFTKSFRRGLAEELSCLELMWRGKELSCLLNLDVGDISENSNDIKKGDVFVAIRGSRCNGADFAREAEVSGAEVFVSEEDLKISCGLIIKVKNARKFMAELCRIVYDFDASEMKIAGITGTKGKTTTAFLAYRLLEKLSLPALFIGTLGVFGIDTHGLFINSNTTQSAPVVYKLLKRASEKGIHYAVIEVSSQAIKDYRIHGLSFDIVAFTSFSPDHIGTLEHESLADYMAKKRELFSSYGALSCISNYDDAYSSYFSAGIGRVLHCGFTPHSDYRITGAVSDFSGTRFSVAGENVSTPLSGNYNAVNSVMAVALASELTGISRVKLFPLLRDLNVSGRFEHFSVCGRDFIIDYAHNKDSFRSMISLARQLSCGRVIAVFGSVGERGTARRREMAECAEELADFSVITSDNPNYEDPNKIALEIYSAFKKKENGRIVVRRDEAIKYAMAVSEPGDTVLLLGKGHEEYMLFMGKRLPFSERKIIADLCNFTHS